MLSEFLYSYSQTEQMWHYIVSKLSSIANDAIENRIILEIKEKINSYTLLNTGLFEFMI